MDLILNTAKENHLSQDDLPARLYIFSDMEFNRCMTDSNSHYGWMRGLSSDKLETLFETIEKRFKREGYEMPQITFWNLDCRNDKNIPAIGDKFNYISGFSMSQMEQVMAGKTAIDLMLEVLQSERYANIAPFLEF